MVPRRRLSLLAPLLVGSFLAGFGPVLAAAPSAQADSTVTVMTRNVYLGADVGAALSLIPDMPGAAQSLWDQLRATDIIARAPALAREIVAAKPDVLGMQEVASWECRAGLGGSTVVFDFLSLILDATRAAGVPYVVASANGSEARNPGYSIPAIPFVTMVHDPATFQPLFGSDDAACGFSISDVIAVRQDRASSVRAAGAVDYAETTALVPVIMVVPRGYVWADIEIDGAPTRFVSTHLESFSSPGAVPPSAIQARQLVRDLSETSMPLVVMGDFNSDPRDPRDPGANPGEQPVVSEACPAQAGSDPSCSAYWTMVGAGFIDAGPDSADPSNLSWGGAADLAGPDAARLDAARAMGNGVGFTDRLDYVFASNYARIVTAHLVGEGWPEGAGMWSCGTRICMASDHAGVVARLAIATGVGIDRPPGPENSLPWGLIIRGGAFALAVSIALVVVGIRKLRRDPIR
jgi:endonuclease/exonuclease/phosphatase family metal-dependent hydrolase